MHQLLFFTRPGNVSSAPPRPYNSSLCIQQQGELALNSDPLHHSRKISRKKEEEEEKSVLEIFTREQTIQSEVVVVP